MENKAVENSSSNENSQNPAAADNHGNQDESGDSSATVTGQRDTTNSDPAPVSGAVSALTPEEQAALDRETDEEYDRLFARNQYAKKKDFFSTAPKGPVGLAEELGIEDIYQPLVGGHGQLFCAAGPEAPLVVIKDDALVIHPPQLPLMAEDHVEEMKVQVSKRGVLLDEFGKEKRVASAKYRGRPIFHWGECVPGTYRSYAIVEASDGAMHFIYDATTGEKLPVDEVYRLRNRTHDGEIGKFPQLNSTLDIQSDEPERVDPEAVTQVGIEQNQN